MHLNTINHPDQLPNTTDPERFLRALGRPSLIRLKGKDPQRSRAFCTLLHGNEPSGVRALIGYFQSRQMPAVNTDIIIAAVETALTAPAFSHRMLPGKRDLNRCFRPPFADAEGKLAQAILQVLQETKPECLVDMHNTSGSGPAFGVAVKEDQHHVALTSLWTNDLILTDLRLGAIMEQSEASVPTVTIECGGVADRSSLIIATEGLQRYLQSEHVMASENTRYGVKCFHNPLRMQLVAGFTLAYKEPDQYINLQSDEADIVLPTDADRLNYGTVPPGEVIAFTGKKGLQALTARDRHGEEQIHHHFRLEQHRLIARHPLKLFMVTTNATIAQKDCLFYFLDCAH